MEKVTQGGREREVEGERESGRHREVDGMAKFKAALT